MLIESDFFAGPCESFPCKNEGICSEEGESFTCKCTGDYQGKTCEGNNLPVYVFGLHTGIVPEVLPLVCKR